MSAFFNVLRKPVVWLWVLVLQWVSVWILSESIRLSVAGGLKGHAWTGGERILPGLFELIMDGGGFMGFVTVLMPALLVVTLLLWIFSLGGVIAGLRESASISSLAAIGLRSAGGVIGVSLWHLPIRLILVVLPFMMARKAFEDGIPLPLLLLILALLCFCSFTLDLARCRVVLWRQSGWHPRTTLAAISDAWRHPGTFGRSALWATLQWFALVAMAWATLNHAGTDSLTLWVRGLAVAGTLFGLSRLAVAVEASSQAPGEFDARSEAPMEPDDESADEHPEPSTADVSLENFSQNEQHDTPVESVLPGSDDPIGEAVEPSDGSQPTNQPEVKNS